MTTRVAFLRAVNVGGRKVPMAQLREALAVGGFTDVETHIQTGNVRLGTTMRSDARIAAALENLMQQEFGFEVPVLLRTPADLVRIVATADAYEDPLGQSERRYVTLLADEPSAERTAELNGWDVDGERLRVDGREVHWWLTKSTHEAKISNARLDRAGGVATTRDLKVMRALADKWGVG